MLDENSFGLLKYITNLLFYSPLEHHLGFSLKILLFLDLFQRYSCWSEEIALRCNVLDKCDLLTSSVGQGWDFRILFGLQNLIPAICQVYIRCYSFYPHRIQIILLWLFMLGIENTYCLEKIECSKAIALVTQPMLQRQPNCSELRLMDSMIHRFYIQILCRFQKCKQKVPSGSFLKKVFFSKPTLGDQRKKSEKKV